MAGTPPVMPKNDYLAGSDPKLRYPARHADNRSDLDLMLDDQPRKVKPRYSCTALNASMRESIEL